MSTSIPAPSNHLWTGTFEGRVNPLSRPRFAKHAYQPLENQRELRDWLESEKPESPWAGSIWIEVHFLFKGKGTADCDNLLKAVFDGLQSSGFIENDKNIVGGGFLRGISSKSHTNIILREAYFYDPSALSSGCG